MFLLYGQQHLPQNNYSQEFANAYNQYPNIPKGVLEGVAYTMTRFQHLQNQQESCTDLPKTYGVMGLTLDGENYFNNNLLYISQVSGISVNDILNSPEQNILAFASAYNHQLQLLSPFKYQGQNVVHILAQLSELPNTSLQADFALNAHLYSVLSFMNNTEMQKTYNFSNPNYDLEKVFGKENLKVLSSTNVKIADNHIEGDEGNHYIKSTINNKSADYPPALSNFTSCNYSSRSGTPVSAVTIHTIQGSYSGCISWFKNCSANVSAHYVLRSSDGQVTQMVYEANKAWHVGNSNPFTIGLEHEGFVNDSTWYTAAMYQASADLVRDITQSGYGINPLRTAYFPWARTTYYNTSNIPGSCVTIKGHQHYPNQTHTDPDSNWDWDYYYKLINDPFTAITTNTNSSGNTTDSGGSAGNYANDERTLYLIQPQNAQSITLTVNQFDVEATWDYLYIYEGTTVFHPLVGVYTGTTIPSTININGGSALIEFRSDCATTKPGYDISWGSIIADTIKPTTQISSSPTPYATGDFTSSFTDTDNIGGSGVMHTFYQVADFNTTEWRANNDNAFFNDNFETAIHPDWIDSSGVWSIVNNKLQQTDQNNTNTNLYAGLDQNNNAKFLYHYKATISGTGNNKRAGFHYMCDDASQTNRGNSYFVWFRQDNGKLQFYKVANNGFTLEKDVVYNFNAGQEYDYKIVYDKTTGITEVYVDDKFIDSWKDNTPLTVGNAVSFRSGDCVYEVDELRVYKNRTASALITVGSSPTNDIRYENNPTTSGKIRSLVIDSAYNVSTITTEMVDVDFATGIDELDAKIAEVYPNPLNNIINISFQENTNARIVLTDANGKQIFQKTIQSKSNYVIDLSAYKLSSGNYFVEIKSNDKIQTIKLIKQ